MKTVAAKSILEMAYGSIMERADYEMEKIVENILNENTDPEAKRTMTLKLVFEPSPDREMVNVNVQASSKLAPFVSLRVGLRVGRSGGACYAKELSAEVPGQLDINGQEEPEPALLSFGKAANK